MSARSTAPATEIAISAGPALADHPYANGEENSNGVAQRGVEEGTLHPGHVAVFATGKGDPAEGRYNRPAEDFHLDGTPYPTGPGGYATTKRNDNAND